MHSATTDEDLARRIQGRADGGQGAEEAEFVRRFAPRIRLYGLRHLRDETSADELVQRVLLVVLTKLRAGAVREPRHIASYVFGTARRTARSLRREEGRVALLGEAHAEIQAAMPPPPEPFPHDALARCLEALGERQRSVVVLSFYQEQGTDDVARVTGLSSGNVRVIRHRALRQLRACLERSEGELS